MNYASSSELDLIVSMDISRTIRLVHLTMRRGIGRDGGGGEKEGKHVHNITIGDARYSVAGNCSIDETAGQISGIFSAVWM